MRNGSFAYKASMKLLAIVFTFSSCGAPVAIEQQIQSAAQEKATTDQLTTLSATSRSSITKQPRLQRLIKMLESEGTSLRYDHVRETQTEDGSTSVVIELSNSNSIDVRFLSVLITNNEIVSSAISHFAKNAEEVRGEVAEVLSGTAINFAAKKVDEKVKMISVKRGQSRSNTSSLAMMSVVETKTVGLPGQLAVLAARCQNEEENLNVALGWLAATSFLVVVLSATLPWSWWAYGAAVSAAAAAVNGVRVASNQLQRCRGL